MMSHRIAWALLCVPVLAVADPSPRSCHVVKADFTPIADPFEPQIVMWIEDSAGHYIDTIFMTEQTGRFGLGNRPGRYDFNSGPGWPYGRRSNVFPVWAHRHGMTFPQVGFQTAIDTNGDGKPDVFHVCCESDDFLSHSRDFSSTELHYCAPRKTSDYPVDAITCASAAFTDKGVFSDTLTSLYPPRTDLTAGAKEDSASVAMYAGMNPFDAISAATPIGNVPYEVAWPIPGNLQDGSYVLFAEVAKEFDQNATYTAAAYPGPEVQYKEYGSPYRGQPSIVYKVPFTLTTTDTTTDITDYAGYGDMDGQTGTLHPPDSTITTAIDRLQLVSTSGTPYRIHLLSHPEIDLIAPAAPGRAQVVDAAALSATVQFTAPGDDGLVGKASSYDIRARVDGPITDDNFADAMQLSANAVPVDPGQLQVIDLTGLLPETTYSVGIRAIDDCGNPGPIAVVQVTTTPFESGSVDACFVATAAYGSLMANDVSMLRRFRDVALRHSVLGELVVESYYTFGPPVAGVIGESEILRATARAILSPIVGWVRHV